MNKEIIIYTSESCDYCKKMKEEFNKQDLSFIEKERTNSNEDWQEIVKLTGMASFPTIVLNNKEFFVPGRDFNSPEQIVSYLKTYKPSEKEYPSDLKLSQGFKTMAFSMNQAMSRIIHQLNELKNEHKSTD